ncbi:MAG: anhydro-N-acetylmuramic acid kinase [Tannerella sp.]|jgi:anhydro-N-acetylmuramic acid kinase|nr:anhydro-N-acetylmuramic acid kinase [Tannerella sp.]
MKDIYNVLGTMSGTSLDGLDLALCRFELVDGRWDYRVLDAQSFPYDPLLRSKLADAITLPAADYALLNVESGRVMAAMINTFLDAQPTKPDFIASHGHTVFHQPSLGLTTQIGSGAVIAAQTGLMTVCDFRSSDLALGGQGAPLVPVGDELLFGNYDACLNLGGISNISFRTDGRRVAYDISPCNMALNYSANLLGLEYDKDGDIARSGTIDPHLLERLNQLDYYQLEGAKSLGKEWFEAVFKPCLDADLPVADLLRTLTEHIALQIAKSSAGRAGETMLTTGGGARNLFLVERLRAVGTKTIIIPDPQTIDFKEAIIFAFLGVLRVRGEANCLCAVTGAERDNCGGAIYL